MKKKIKRNKNYVCLICKGNKKVQAKMKCCSSKMTSPSKGSWNL